MYLRPQCRATRLAVPSNLHLHLVANGCSVDDGIPSRPKVVPASRIVLYQGKPVGGAEDCFVNHAASRTGFAVTDQSGKFVLTTFDDKDGVVPGRQHVAIRRVNVTDKTPASVDVSAGGVGLSPEITWLSPKQYSDADKSGLSVEVTESGSNEFTFDLK